MSTLLVALLAVMLLPLFLANWKASLFGLCCQGLLMGWMELEARSALGPNDWLTLFDLIVVRGLLAPWLLYGVLRTSEGFVQTSNEKGTGRNDVIPPNLLSWTLVVGLVFLAFSVVPSLTALEGVERQRVAVATTGLLLGFFVLATQSGTFSQMVGALRFENAIALFELGLPAQHESVALRAGQILVFVVTVGAFRWYLEQDTAESPPENAEGPTL